MALQLRQEAGYGCCQCGKPFLQYHHIIPWAQEEHFRPEDMMALCAGCHDEVTQAPVPEPEQRRWKAKPHNITHGYTAGFLRINTAVPVLSAGSNVWINDGPLIMFGEKPLLSLGVNNAGGLELSLDLEDEQGKTLAMIDRNDWMSGDASLWDIQAKYRWLRIRRRSRVKMRRKRDGTAPRRPEVLLEVDTRTVPMTIRAALWFDKRNCMINPEAVSFGASRPVVFFKGLRLVGAYFAFHRLEPTEGGGHRIEFEIRPDPRFLERDDGPYLCPGVDEGDIASSVEAFGRMRERNARAG